MKMKILVIFFLIAFLMPNSYASEIPVTMENCVFYDGNNLPLKELKSGSAYFEAILKGNGNAKLITYCKIDNTLFDIDIRSITLSQSGEKVSSDYIKTADAEDAELYAIVLDASLKNSASYKFLSLYQALERFDNISDKGIVDFFIRLYDPETGGFCYSPSANDLPGYEAELEATATIMACLPGMGLVKSDFVSDPEVPDGFFEKMIEFYQSRQNPDDGYWYDPLYGNSMIETKRERTSSKALGNLDQIGGKPLYPTYQDRINTASLMSTTSLPSHFASEEAYIDWMANKNWTDGTYATGNEITNSLTIAKNLGYGDAALEFILSKQNPKTGCWGVDTITSDTTNGALKLSDAIIKLGGKYPYVEQAVDTVITFVENETTPENMCTIWNPLILIYNIRKSNSNVFPADVQAKLDRKIVSLLDKTYNFLTNWRTDDGGYKYYPTVPIAEYGGVDACRGTDSVGNFEGNEDSTVIGSYLMRNSVYAAAGFDSAPAAWKKYKTYFWDEIEKKMALSNKKYKECTEYSENFESVYSISSLYNTWGFLLQSKNDSVKLISENGNRVLQINTAPTLREKGGRDRFTTNFKIPEGETYTAQFKFKIGSNSTHPVFNIYLGSRAVNLCLMRNTLTGGTGNNLVLAYRTNADVGATKENVITKNELLKDKWYTLKIEYTPKGKSNTITKIYLDGNLLLETDKYFNGGFSERLPVKNIRFLKFEAYDRNTTSSLFLDDLSVSSK